MTSSPRGNLQVKTAAVAIKARPFFPRHLQRREFSDDRHPSVRPTRTHNLTHK